MELILKTDLAKAIPQEIDFNHEELKSQLSERLERYNSLVVTEDAIQPAKKDRAALNKLKSAIDDKRKSVKGACLAPYTEFERKAKELIGMVQEPIDVIDRQVKGFEEQKKREKYQKIDNFYRANIGELIDLVSLEKIIPEKWANSGTVISSVMDEILATITKVRNNLQIIQTMGLTFEQQVTDVYLRTLSMSSALAEKARLEEQEKKISAAKKQREAESAVAVSPPAPPEPQEEPAEGCETVATEPVQQATEETKTIDVRFYKTTEAFRREMKALTQKHGIKYGGIN